MFAGGRSPVYGHTGRPAAEVHSRQQTGSGQRVVLRMRVNEKWRRGSGSGILMVRLMAAGWRGGVAD